MKKLKEHSLLVVLSIILIVLGVFLLIVDASKVMGFIYYALGIGLILCGFGKLFTANNNRLLQYDALINITEGVLIMFFHNIVLTIILAIIFLIFPIIRIIKSSDKKTSLYRELPLLIIGVVIALSGDLLANILTKAIGVALIILAIYILISIFKTKSEKEKTTSSNSEVIEAIYEERDLNE